LSSDDLGAAQQRGGLVFPKGKHDVNGTGGTPKTAFYRHEKSYVVLLKIEGKTVRGSKP
jgi:hypothetical protein